MDYKVLLHHEDDNILFGTIYMHIDGSTHMYSTIKTTLTQSLLLVLYKATVIQFPALA